MAGRRPFRFILVLVGSCLAPVSAVAHEFWIEPLQFRIAAGQEIRARLKVGQNFSGDNLPFLPDRIKEAGITDRFGTTPLTGMVGDLPAISARPPRTGLHVIHYYSRPSTLTHADFNRFTEFVESMGLDPVLQAHGERGLPESGFIEAFSRCVKALVQVGEVGGGDVLTGMPLELLAEANPYALSLQSGSLLPVRLFWLGEPLADTQVTIFRKSGDLKVTKLRTGSDGRALIPLGGGGTFMLNALRIIPRDDETSIVWHSYWASMTFQVGDDL